MTMTGNQWQIWIDTGGTFTDCFALDPQGAAHRAKVLSSGALRGVVRTQLEARVFEVGIDWPVSEALIIGAKIRPVGASQANTVITRFDESESRMVVDGDEATLLRAGDAFEVLFDDEPPVLAARLVTQTPPDQALPPLAMRLASTRGTNALLEQRGAKVALFVTKGFGDLLDIGDQQRPDLFALDIRKAPALYSEVIEVSERLDSSGSVIAPLCLDTVAVDARRALENGVEAAAIALLHSYRNPAHEHELAQMLRNLGFGFVSCSADLAPLIKVVPRAETAVVNSYLAPVIESYLAGVVHAMGTARIHVMTSAGGLTNAAVYTPKDSLLSGPAGGVAGAAAAGRRSGFDRIIGFDMGGTSTDVARYDGDFEYTFEHRVGGARLLAPALAIETVAAGGGSICAVHNGALTVGPQSAGANPGPACYGAGGPLTLTDVNLLAGRLDPERFTIPVFQDAAATSLDELLAQVGEPPGNAATTPEQLLSGLIELANERMADAIAEVSVRQGYDPREFALVAFGGAGGQHGCGVANRLGIETVIMPADASLLSAIGLGHAVVERIAQAQVLETLDEFESASAARFLELELTARSQLVSEGVADDDITVRRRLVHMRQIGQDSTIAVELAAGASLETAFRSRYEAIYGHRPADRTIEVESIRVVMSSHPTVGDAPMTRQVGRREVSARDNRRCLCAGQFIDAPVFERADLVPGSVFDGPCLIVDQHTMCVIDPGWTGIVDNAKAVVLRRDTDVRDTRLGGDVQIVREALFSNRLTAIADQMGRMLERTALSTNVKERLDFSCALLDRDGLLIVNAPHMPVHLGAMGFCVRAVRDAVPLESGDVVVTNHPAYGGSHLPDLTVVTPVHDDAGALLGYAASRAHHAELGGIRPGSMSPLATSLADEAVIIPPMRVLQNGHARFDVFESLLRTAAYPSRAVEDNLADLRAAIASNHHGAIALQDLARSVGSEVVVREIEAIRIRAAALAQRAMRARESGVFEAVEELDGGGRIAVRIEIGEGQARFDFSGTSDIVSSNLNATPAIVHSAVIYVLRLLIGESLPLNEGLMDAVTLVVPRGMLNPDFSGDPSTAPAISGGNVETSQRLVNLLLKALGMAAGSQGTMNNTLFGDDRFSYYETVCGGSGATSKTDGADAVHTHMTNTKITDPEILELRYPVRLHRFAVRRNSGGAGRRCGGNGVVREIEFLEPMSLSILSQNRDAGPFGLEGGAPGAPGHQRIIRADGSVTELAAIDSAEVDRGDRLVMKTPGGGGCGAMENIAD